MGVLIARQLDWVDWISVIGSVISIASVVWFLFGLISRLRRASFLFAFQEFTVLVRRPAHATMLVVVVIGSAVLVVWPPSDFPMSLLTLVPVVSAVLLLLSFFLAQNNRLTRKILLNEVERVIARSNKKRNQPCSAIRFDIDLIVAINDYSFAVGTHIFELVKDTIDSAVSRLRDAGIEVSKISIPEGDEEILILPGVHVDAAADIADEVRRQVKAGLPRIPYYSEASEYVIAKLQNPPLTAEEEDGIGTLSAGVAGYARGAEALLSDISSAVKEAKFRGRNKTVIYGASRPSIIRSDYVPKQSRESDIDSTGN